MAEVLKREWVVADRHAQDLDWFSNVEDAKAYADSQALVNIDDGPYTVIKVTSFVDSREAVYAVTAADFRGEEEPDQ